jgi:hypothetical protein
VAWDETELREDLTEIFSDDHSVTPHFASEGLVVRQLSHYNRPPGRNDDEMREYKRQKQNQYRSPEYIKNKYAIPSDATKEVLRQRAQKRKLMRERMPELREGTTHHFTILARCNKLKCVAGKIEGKDGPYTCPRCGGDGVREVDGYITCNTYEDGRLGELFIRVGKSGAEEAIYEQWAIGASVAIQFGVPVEAYFRKFLATQFEPAGATKNKSIARCTSVLDYVARYVLMKFCPAESTEKAEVQP